MTRTLTTGELRGGRLGDELGEVSDVGVDGGGRWNGMELGWELGWELGALLAKGLDGLDGFDASDGSGANVTSSLGAAATRSVVAALSSGQFTLRIGERAPRGGTGIGTGMLSALGALVALGARGKATV